MPEEKLLTATMQLLNVDLAAAESSISRLLEAEQLFQEELGMVKVEIDHLEQEFIVSRQYLHEGMQYTCTYMCPNHEVRNKWATQKEKIDYVSTQKVCYDAVKLMLDRADETGDPDGLYKKYAAEWERRKKK